jgi:hypothetical protein
LWRSPNHREKGGGDYTDPAKALARVISGHQVNLQDQVLAMWATPAARDYKHPNAKPFREREAAGRKANSYATK